MQWVTREHPKIDRHSRDRRACGIRPRRIAIVAFATLLTGCSGPVASAGSLPLKIDADVPLTGHATRWDYASFDPGRHRLFVAHMGDGVVTVFDTQDRAAVADIPNIRDVHGVLAIPELGRIYASATGTNQVVVIDATTLTVTARIPGGIYPDGMAYAPGAHRLFVSDESGATETVIDTVNNTRIATLPLGGELGNSQYDPVSKHIFVNVQGRNDLVEIDPANDTILARHPLPGAKGNHGLLIDPDHRLAFIACEDNNRLLVVDMASMTVLATFTTGSGPDVLGFDPSLGLLYVASESGVVSLFRVKGHGVEKIGEELLGANAHVVAVDASTHRAYFPLKDVGGRPVLRITTPIEAASGR